MHQRLSNVIRLSDNQQLDDLEIGRRRARDLEEFDRAWKVEQRRWRRTQVIGIATEVAITLALGAFIVAGIIMVLDRVVGR